MNWQVKILDPSGEIRNLPLNATNDNTLAVGRDPQAPIPLRDPTVPPIAGVLHFHPLSPILGERSPYWLRIPGNSPAAQLGGFAVREAQLPAGLPVRIGESVLTVEPRLPRQAVPEQPSGLRHWLTCNESGRKALWMAKKAAATPLSIYIAGETGTGKEVVAQLIHAWSGRASGPFVPLHCGALALSLAESELFGHVKGAFTGAIQHRPGALMQAHGGTLFLDEVGDLPMDIQVKLLRFLENGEIRPVGADRPSRADVRLLCATHLPLQKLVDEGKFRRDLYYRLASVTLDLPPLRERPEDIEMLSRKFASELSRALSPAAILRLQAYDWPGNVRELRHTLERASGMAGPFCPFLGEEAFEFLLTQDSLRARPELEVGAAMLSLREMERVMLLKALRLAGGNRARAAKMLGIARSTLFEMLKRHRIAGPRTVNRELNSPPAA